MKPVDPLFSAKARNMSAIAAVAVMVTHAGSGGMGSFTAKMMHQFMGWGICTFAVPWFFFASGYFFAGRLDEPGWWKRAVLVRLKTLALPYLLWCGIFVCFAAALDAVADLHDGRAVLAGRTLGGTLWVGFGLDFFDHPSLVPFWYIRALALIVCLSPALVWALRRWGWFVPLAILPAYVYCCGLNNCHAMPWFVFYSPFSLAGWLYFSIGALARIRGADLSCRHVGTPVFLAAALVIVCAGRLAQYWRHPETAGVLWLVGIPFLMLAAWRLVPSTVWPKWFVSAAFPVYALHYFVVYFLEKTFLPLAHPAWWAYPLRAALTVSISLAVASLLRRHVPESRILFGGR